MANNLQDDIRRFVLEINESKNNGQTLANLTKLEKETSKLRQENEDLQKVMAHLASQGKKNSDEYKRMDAQLKANKKSIADNSVQMKGLQKNLDLNYMSMGQLRKRAGELRSTLNATSKAANPQEYNRLESELKQVGTQMDKLKGKSGQTQNVVGKLKGVAAGLLPAFGFAAIAAGAKKAFDSIVSATDTLGTKWDVFVGGLKEGTNEFWRTLATGDWSNFTENMRAAVRVGREYQIVLDELEARQRGFTVLEANARKEILVTEDIVRNVSLSNEERTKAAERRIQIEEELAAKRTKIATQQYDNELMMASQAAHLDKERLMQVVSDIDSETKARAEAYNIRMEEIRKIERQQGNSGLVGGVTQFSKAGNPRLKQLKEETAAVDEATKFYAEALAGAGRVTDEQLNKLVQAYSEMKNAEVSALENTRRVRSQMYTIFDEENRLAAAAAKAAAASASGDSGTGAKAIISTSINEILNMQELLSETEKEILESNAANLASIEEDVAKTIAENQGEIDKAVESSMQTSENLLAFEEAQAEKRKQLYMDIAMSIGATYGDMLANTEKSFADFARATILAALDALHQFFLIKKAEAIIGGIAKGNPLSIIAAVAKVAAMEAAFQAVRGAVANSGKSLGSKREGGFGAKGPSDDQVAGFYHANEFIGNADSVRNPQIKRFYDIIDLAQKNGTVRSLNLAAIAGPGKKTGGYADARSASAVSPPSQGGVPTGGGGNDTAKLIAKFDQMIAAMKEIRPRVAIDAFEREKQKYIDIQKFSNM